MLCCAALLFVLGIVREVWFRLPFTTRKPEPGFAPVAHRPAPGTAPVVATVAPPAPIRRGAMFAPALVGFAVNSLLYVVFVVGLIDTGVAIGNDGPWALRTAGFVIAALIALFLAARTADATHRHPAVWLIGAGAAWWLLGLVDMHAFGLFDIRGGIPADLAFHGSGAVLIVVGAIAFVRTSQKEFVHVR
ncbi:hypothetical protein SMNI109538_18195 [Smaragdicoccus niigatensis]